MVKMDLVGLVVNWVLVCWTHYLFWSKKVKEQQQEEEEEEGKWRVLEEGNFISEDVL
jgi:hypothetical protein